MEFEHLTYNELLEDYINDYLTDYGRIKYEKVYNKIYASKKLSKLILFSKENMLIPTAKDYLNSINEIPFFIFSKSDTIALGCLLCVERWNKECNQTHKLANEAIIKDVAVRILKECLSL